MTGKYVVSITDTLLLVFFMTKHKEPLHIANPAITLQHLNTKTI